MFQSNFWEKKINSHTCLVLKTNFTDNFVTVTENYSQQKATYLR